MENPTLKFYETIGPHYVYGYWCNETDRYKYIGMGVGQRCHVHATPGAPEYKGYDLEDCHILVKNLQDSKQAALVEALLIHQHVPVGNRVRGHHTGRFIMASLKGLFGDFVDSQRNYHYELAETLVEHEKVLRTTMGGCGTNNSGFNIWSGVRKSTNIVISASSDGVQVKIQSQPTPGNTDHFDDLCKKVVPMLEEEYELNVAPNKNGVGGKVEFDVEDIATAIGLWDGFHF